MRVLIGLAAFLGVCAAADAQQPPAAVFSGLTVSGLTIRGSAPQTLLTIPATLGTTQAALDYQNLGASIQRLNDRVLVGAATVNDGTSAQTRKDWLEALIPSTTAVAQFAALSTIGGFGVVGGSRSSDGGPNVGFDVGVAAFAVGDDLRNDNKTTTAFYAEARRLPGLRYEPGNAHGNFVVAQENDIHNMAGPGSAVGSMDPYRMYQGLTAANTLLASGKPGLSTVDATVALGVFNNGSAFRHGIVVGASALTGDTGTSGVGSAIALAAGHQIEWYAPGQGDVPQAAIRSDIAADGTARTGTQLIRFTPAGIAFGAHGTEELTVDVAGHLRVGADRPTVSACGEGGTVQGSDQAGLVSVGGGARTCALTFARRYGGVPTCVVTGQAGGAVPGYTLAVTGISLSGLVPRGRYNYVCFAQAGG